jgi:hypothetical protein
MNNKRRGCAIIFNHKKFDNASLKLRTEPNDCANLERTLTCLGFEVVIHNDLTCNNIKETVEEG